MEIPLISPLDQTAPDKIDSPQDEAVAEGSEDPFPSPDPDSDGESETVGAPAEFIRLMELWNSIPGIQHFRSPTRKRVASFRQRMATHGWKENVRRALECIDTNDFYKGRNRYNWLANIDWFLRPDTVQKVVERSAVKPESIPIPANNAAVVQRVIKKLTQGQEPAHGTL